MKKVFLLLAALLGVFASNAATTLSNGCSIDGITPNAENESFSTFTLTVPVSYLRTVVGNTRLAFDGWRAPDFATGNNRGTLVLPDKSEVNFDIEALSSSSGRLLGHTFETPFTAGGEYTLKINLGGAAFADSNMATGTMWPVVPDGTVIEIPFSIKAAWTMPTGVTVTGFKVNEANPNLSKFEVGVSGRYFAGGGSMDQWLGTSFGTGNNRGTLVLPDKTEVIFDLSLASSGKFITHTFDPAYTTPGNYTLKINLGGAQYADATKNPMLQTVPEGNVIVLPFSIEEPKTVDAPVASFIGITSNIGEAIELPEGANFPVGLTVSDEEAQISYCFTQADAPDNFQEYSKVVVVREAGNFFYKATRGEIESEVKKISFTQVPGTGFTLPEGVRSVYPWPGHYTKAPYSGFAFSFNDGTNYQSRAVGDERPGGIATMPDGTTKDILITNIGTDGHSVSVGGPGWTDGKFTINFDLLPTGNAFFNQDPFKKLSLEFPAVYFIGEGPAAPVAKISDTEVEGKYEIEEGQTVSVALTSDVEGAEIYYKWNDAVAAAAAVEATDNFVKYEAPVEVASAGTLEYYAQAANGLQSATKSVEFTVKPKQEESNIPAVITAIDPEPGTYEALDNAEINLTITGLMAVMGSDSDVFGTITKPNGDTVDLHPTVGMASNNTLVLAVPAGTFAENGTYTVNIKNLTGNQVYGVSGGVPAFSFQYIISVETGIDGVEVVKAEVKYFDLNGRRVLNPENGIFVKVVDGKAHKVLVK